MITYSLLLQSLEPKPTRQELEEISQNVRSIARADCAFIAEDWYGIVTTGLPLAEAETFRAGLQNLGIGADLVADSEIPTLHNDFRCQRIDLNSDEIILSTAMARRYPRRRDDLVYVSAGFVYREKASRDTEMQPQVRYSRYGAYTVQVEKSVLKIEEKRFLRIDFFFTSEPNRISLELGKDTVIFYGDRPMRMENQLDLTVLMVDLQSLLPPERMNRSLKDLSLHHVYPSMHAYEEELRWAFYRLDAKG